MKITTFNPLIITKNVDEVVRVFEELGFEKRHAPSGTSGAGNEYMDYRMTDANGFHVDVAYIDAPVPQDITAIRVNVDNFDEGYRFLTEHGFKSPSGKPVTETDHSKGVLMTSPSGFGIVLCQHIKK